MKLLSGLSGSADAKGRFAAIVSTLTGEKSVPDVCAELGICEARFHEMRKEFLAGAVGLLEKRPAGRKPAAGPEPDDISLLRDENKRLRLEVEASRIKAELALVLPHVLKSSKKTKRGRRGS
jgi:hypothetical protein